MTTAALILAAYLTAGLATALYWHRYRLRLTLRGQWALLVCGWPLVLLVDYCAEKEFGRDDAA